MFSNQVFSDDPSLSVKLPKERKINVCGQLSTYTLSNATSWGCGRLFKAPLSIPPSADGNYFQIIFMNRSREVIKTFFSLQENIQQASLKYASDGGLKSAEFKVLFNATIPSYNDMLVEFRTARWSLGTVFTTSVAVVDNILSISGTSAFNRFAMDLQLTGDIKQKSLKEVIMYFVQLIYNAVVADGEQPFFTVSEETIIVDNSLIIDSVFFTNKKPIDILKGLANLAGGHIVYGVDEFFRFYFIDQRLLQKNTKFVDADAFQSSMQSDDESITNRVRLYSQTQTGEELGLIATHNDLESQAQFGIKPVSINLPFHLNSSNPASYARLFATPSPLLKGSFRMISFDDPVGLGQYRVCEYLSNDRRILANSCKNLSTLGISSEETTKVTAGFVTGRFAFQFRGGSVFIKAYVHRCKYCVLTMRSEENVTLEWSYDGIVYKTELGMSDRMRQITIDTMGLDSGLSVASNGRFVIDSLHYVTDFVQWHEGYYQGHEISMKGNLTDIKITMGLNKNSIVDLTKDLEKNARQLDDLLKRK